MAEPSSSVAQSGANGPEREKVDSGLREEQSSENLLKKQVDLQAKENGASAEGTETAAQQTVSGKDESEAKETKKRRRQSHPTSPTPAIVERPHRERKTIDRFAVEDPRNKTPLKPKKGKGTPLKEIPTVVSNLGKKTTSSDILNTLHLLLFGKRAKADVVKANILKFSGFASDGPVEEERARLKEKLERLTKDSLAGLSELMGLQTSGQKTQIVDRLLAFLESPVNTLEKKGGSKPAAAVTPRSKAKTPPAKRRKTNKSEQEDDEEEDQDDDEDDEYEGKKAKRPSSNSSRTTPTSLSGTKTKQSLAKARPTLKAIRTKVEELVQGKIGKEVDLDSVMSMLGESFSGDIEAKRDLVESIVAEVSKGSAEVDNKSGVVDTEIGADKANGEDQAMGDAVKESNKPGAKEDVEKEIEKEKKEADSAEENITDAKKAVTDANSLPDTGEKDATKVAAVESGKEVDAVIEDVKVNETPEEDGKNDVKEAKKDEKVDMPEKSEAANATEDSNGEAALASKNPTMETDVKESGDKAATNAEATVSSPAASLGEVKTGDVADKEKVERPQAAEAPAAS